MEEKKPNSLLSDWLSQVNTDNGKLTSSIGNGEQRTQLSYGEQRLFFLQQLNENNPFYHFAEEYFLTGDVQVDALQKSFEALYQKHDSLCATYSLKEDQLVLDIQKENPFEFTYLEIIDQQQLEQLAKETARKPFDLSKGPLSRILLVKKSQQAYYLLIVMHHIITDKWSMKVVRKEITQYYNELLQGSNPTIEPLPLQYSDYAYEQVNKTIKPEDLAYWREKLSGEIPTNELPFAKPRPPKLNYKGKYHTQRFPKHIYKGIQHLCVKTNSTPFQILLTTFNILLSKYYENNDIILGTPYSTRRDSNLEKLIGFFNETIVLRCKLAEHSSFSQVLEQVKTDLLDSFSNNFVPFDEIVNEIKPARELNRNPFFQQMFLYHKVPKGNFLGPNISCEYRTYDLDAAKFDLTLYISEDEDSISGIIEFATQLFEEKDIEKMFQHYFHILSQVIEDEHKPVANIEYVTPAEAEQITQLNTQKLTEIDYTSFLADFLSQVKSNPTQTALSFKGESLTYKALNERANQLAQTILSHSKTGNQRIGLYTPKSLEMIVGILGILKSGNAYVPLDPDYPANRINYMVADSGIDIIVEAENNTSQSWEGKTVLSFKENANEEIALPFIQPEHEAYVIYTSGSSGKPKGVPVSHKNLGYSNASRKHFYSKNPSSFLLLSSFSFDSSVAGIFWTLATGGKLVIPEKDIEKDVDSLTTLIEQEAVSHSLMLPSLYKIIVDYASPKQMQSLHAVIVAGEACPSSLIHQHFTSYPAVKLYNEYGPTEGTVWSTAHQITEADVNEVPIGKSLPHSTAYVLDKALNLKPVGHKGTLFIGGSGVAKGYHNLPELTASKFIANPFVPGEVLYNTGDVAKLKENGDLLFYGRNDAQIKIRGYRVELEEISNKVKAFSGVEEAVTKYFEEQASIITYFTANTNADISKIKARLASELPSYMVPESLVQLEAFTKLPNGKIDVTSLGFSRNQAETKSLPPTTALEQALWDVWAEVLEHKQFGVNENFFDIGGDSLMSIRVIAKAKKQNIQIKPSELINGTIQRIAQRLSPASNAIQKPAWEYLVPFKECGDLVPVFCFHSGGSHVFFYKELASLIEDGHPVYGVQPRGLNGEVFHANIEEMATAYLAEIKALYPKGPYHLVGYCQSSAIVMEIVRQLQKNREDTGLLYVIDSYAYPWYEAYQREHHWSMQAKMKKLFSKQGLSYVASSLKRRVLKQPTEQAYLADPQLLKLHRHIWEVFKAYSWQPIDHEIILIRSSEYSQTKDREYHIKGWRELSNNQLESDLIPALHDNIMESPYVQDLAGKMNEYFKKYRNGRA